MTDGWQTVESKAKKRTERAERRAVAAPNSARRERGGGAASVPRGGRGQPSKTRGYREGGDFRVASQPSLGPIDLDHLRQAFPASHQTYPFWMLLGYRTHEDCVAGSFDPPTMISERGPIYGVDLLVGVRSQCVHAPTQLVVPKTILKSSEPPSDLTTPTHNDSRADVEVWERAANDPMNRRTYDESSWLAAQERDKTDEDKLVQRKLRSTLNKLTDTNFDRLKDRLVTQCGMKSVVHVQCLIELLFEKAVAQQQSAFLYSRLVKEMGDELSKILQSSDELKENTRKPERLFRWLVIDRLERNFKASIETKFEPAADLTEEEEFEEFLKYQEKQTGLLRFVGLLLAHNLLPARCAIGIMEELVEGKDAQRLEALCPFMENAGAKIIHSNSKQQYCDFVDTKVGQLTDDPEVPVRIRILLQESVKTHLKKLVE